MCGHEGVPLYAPVELIYIFWLPAGAGELSHSLAETVLDHLGIKLVRIDPPAPLLYLSEPHPVPMVKLHGS